MDSRISSSAATSSHSLPTNQFFSTTTVTLVTIATTRGTETDSAAELPKTLIPEQYQVVLLSFAYGIISMLALIGNSSIIYIVLRNRRMHSVTNYFICNLALSDCLVACFAVPFQVRCILHKGREKSLYLRPRSFLHLVSSSSSSKMGFTSFSLQISTLRANPVGRCLHIHTGCCLTRSLSRYATSIKTEIIE